MQAVLHRAQKLIRSKPSQPQQQAVCVLLGGPGAGKGVFGRLISAELLGQGGHSVSVGDLVRSSLQDASFAQHAADVRRGRLLPDSVVSGLLERRLAAGRAQGEAGVVLDGFPRTLPQAEALLRAHPVRAAVHLRASDEVLYTRCMARQVCRECGRSYAQRCPTTSTTSSSSSPSPSLGHSAATSALSPPGGLLGSSSSSSPAAPSAAAPSAGTGSGAYPPTAAPACSALGGGGGSSADSQAVPAACRGKLGRRGDDAHATIQRRIETYKRESAPIDALFREAGLLVEVDVECSVSEGWGRLLAGLQKQRL